MEERNKLKAEYLKLKANLKKDVDRLIEKKERRIGRLQSQLEILREIKRINQAADNILIKLGQENDLLNSK